MNPVAGGIRTPDQRLRVFVSSTLKELAPERRAVAGGGRAARARAGDVRTRGAAASAEVAVPRLPRPERHLRGRVLGAVRLGGPRRGCLGPGRRVEPRTRHPEAHLPEAQRAPAGAARRPDRTDPRRAMVRPTSSSRMPRGWPISSPPTSQRCSPSASTRAGGRHEPLGAPTAEVFSTEPVRPPSPLTRMVGRADELATLSKMLTSDGQRLVTVTGPGRHRQEPARGGRGARLGVVVPRRGRVRRPRSRARRRPRDHGGRECDGHPRHRRAADRRQGRRSARRPSGAAAARQRRAGGRRRTEAQCAARRVGGIGARDQPHPAQGAWRAERATRSTPVARGRRAVRGASARGQARLRAHR